MSNRKAYPPTITSAEKAESQPESAPESASPAPVSAPASESTSAPAQAESAASLDEIRELLRQQSNLRQTVETLMNRVDEQGKLLLAVTTELREVMQRMKDTMEIAQQAIAANDDQTDKLADVTAALIKTAQVQQAYMQQKANESAF